MNKNFVRLAFLFAALALTGRNAAAQEMWEPLLYGPINTWTGELYPEHTLAMQSYSWYNHVRGTYDGDGNYASLPGGENRYNFTQGFYAYYMATKRLELATMVTFLHNNVKTAAGDSGTHNGMQDTQLFMRYVLSQEQGWAPTVTFQAQAKLPTGKFQNANPDKQGADIVGTGSWDAGCGFNFTKRLKPVIVHGDVFFTVPSNATVDGAKTEYATYWNYDLAVEYPFSHGMSALVEFNGFYQGNKTVDGVEQNNKYKYLNTLMGLTYLKGRMQVYGGYMRTLSGVNAYAYDSALLSLAYTF